MELDHDACYRALRTRDARFDGRLFVGVKTTGVYCRPICPARTPKRENVQFFTTAAAAQEAGFRSCLRCRPEASPDLAVWRGTSNTVSRGLALIAEGALDADDAAMDALAERLGLGERQLRRLFKRHLGASPIAVAQTRRVLFAQQLIAQTKMPMADVALAAGFGSVRRFNATFQTLYGRPPRELRRDATVSGKGNSGDSSGSCIELALPYAPPYDWQAMLTFLRARAIPGVETVTNDSYQRTIRVDGRVGMVEVRPDSDGANRLRAVIHLPAISALLSIVNRLRRVFDLAADPLAIGAHLGDDPRLAPLLAARPGLRVPGAWDGFELAIRAVLGQQITVSAATKLAGRLVAAFGETLSSAASDSNGAWPALTHCFPQPERLAQVSADAMARTLGMPRSRASTLIAVAAAAANNPGLFTPGQTLDAALAALRALPGIGEWTAQYIAMRALREPDAFPASDIGLLRAMADARTGARPTPAALLVHAERWRPWRAYAALHLWMQDAPSVLPSPTSQSKERVGHVTAIANAA